MEQQNIKKFLSKKRIMGTDSNEPKNILVGGVKVCERHARFIAELSEKFFISNWSETLRQMIQFSFENKELFEKNINNKSQNNL